MMCITWGDQTFEQWIGPFESGEVVTFNHTYNQSGSFTIITIAQDSLLGKSPQSKYDIKIIKNKAAVSPLILKIQEYFNDIFQNKFPIIRALLRL